VLLITCKPDDIPRKNYRALAVSSWVHTCSVWFSWPDFGCIRQVHRVWSQQLLRGFMCACVNIRHNRAT